MNDNKEMAAKEAIAPPLKAIGRKTLLMRQQELTNQLNQLNANLRQAESDVERWQTQARQHEGALALTNELLANMEKGNGEPEQTV